MALVYTEEQEMVRDSAKGFLAEKASVSVFRKMRDAADSLGWSRALWVEMAEMGWAGILVEEQYGGLDFGMTGAALILEEMGKNLTASPFLSSAVMASQVLRGASEAQKQAWLPKMVSGEAIIALALDEGIKHDPAGSQLQAEKLGNGYRLKGSKTYIIDGFEADGYLVLARTDGEAGDKEGLSLFLVDARAKGISTSSTKLLDSRNYAGAKFDNVEVSGGDLIGEAGKGLDALEPALNAGRIGLAAEMLGASAQCFESSMEYLKDRSQFGQKIGSFQGLQHRSAHLYCELELVRSAVIKAGQDFEASAEHSGMIASLAKAKSGEVAILAANEGVQMLGGIGMTDEHDMGLYMKRIRAAQELLGDYAFHANRFAKWRGF
ncbi:MAG: acyl-CoA dehydrogenase [Robiginitomaculum sp.]|nr:MAG: acyl-CoA dehydrogenase [Robiginitomaculum sp.]